MNYKIYLIAILLIFISCNSSTDKAISFLNKGDKLYKEGKYTEALNCFFQAERLDSTLIDLYYNIGCSFFELKNYDSAILYFDKELERNFGDYEAHLFKAQSLLSLKRPEDALKEINIGFLLDTNEANAYFMKGMAMFQLGNYLEAIESHTKAISINPTDEDFYLRRSVAYRMENNFDKAFQDIESAINLNPQWHEGYFLKALFFNEIHQGDSACFFWEKAKSLNPKYINYTLDENCN